MKAESAFERTLQAAGIQDGNPDNVQTVTIQKHGRELPWNYETMTPETFTDLQEEARKVLERLQNTSYAERVGLIRQMVPGIRFYHGGFAGLKPGEILKPSPPHVYDGCPVCVARSEGRVCTAGEYRLYLAQFPPERSRKVLELLEGVPDDQPIDPPSARDAVYITTEIDYARWYGARSGHGDLYLVEPVGPITLSTEDVFETYTVAEARVVEVIERRIHLTRKQRRDLDRQWGKRDRRIQRMVRGLQGSTPKDA